MLVTWPAVLNGRVIWRVSACDTVATDVCCTVEEGMVTTRAVLDTLQK